MTYDTALIVFLPCLGSIIAGSIWLSRGLDELGSRFAMLPGLLGLITALGADSPEISSAVTALFAGEHEVGVGVVLGSNLFNLAALMGVSALISRDEPLKRPGLIFSGAVSLLVTGIAAVLILQMLDPAWCMVLLGGVFAVYALVLWIHAPEVRKLPLPAGLSDALAQMVGEVHAHANKRDQAQQRNPPARRGWATAAITGMSLLLIVLGSMGIVHAALTIGAAWGIPKGLVGALVLAALTGLPNAYTSARLALRRKGAAVVSETLNSNTINIVVGIGLPALIFGVRDPEGVAVMELWWLIGLTAAAVLMAAWDKGLSRRTGIAIIVLYLAFAAERVYLQ